MCTERLVNRPDGQCGDRPAQIGPDGRISNSACRCRHGRPVLYQWTISTGQQAQRRTVALRQIDGQGETGAGMARTVDSNQNRAKHSASTH